ncbi:hypothetical protein [Actinomadura sp. WMMB 499]|uniref:hypothetical protein n=1 Tax=Actinomadura sp. WMMB 499 TaxID=1219491 RepID=UPI0012489532|nr:hypothetical protein [Actinomadura sp. WMMB 499]QFG22939.1 hypothetical protein F7P10_19275 [Actinomadura sp. WMMB 499]
MPASTVRWRRPAIALVVAVLMVTSVLVVFHRPASAEVAVSTFSVKGTDGKTYSVTNHIVQERRHRSPRREWLLAWTGAANYAGDGTEEVHEHGSASGDEGAAPDFLAVIDATEWSPTYGKVVNTATVGPLVNGEPHHMQYMWHKGHRVYAGTMFTDTTYVFDVTRLPEIRLTGVNLSHDTPCGSVPDAFVTTSDGAAYGSYMGGPDVSGPCRYTNGEVRLGNGFAGSPGELVRIGPDGRTRSETPAALAGGEDPEKCRNIPPIEEATCANPHGIQVREDLDRLIMSDFAEVRNYLDPDTNQSDPRLLRDTLRIFDISERDRPRLVSVSELPSGPRPDQLPAFDEDRMVMETALTHQRRHRGAFASTMAGGAVFYTPDITVDEPEWREVFDTTAAYRRLGLDLSGSNAGNSWLQVSPDDRYLFQAVMGSDPRLPEGETSGMVFVLDVRRLLASGPDPECEIDALAEVSAGGAEPDCPALIDAEQIKGGIGGPQGRVGTGPHWGAMDNFRLGWDGRYRETSHIRRIATSNYFVAQTGIDGDHKICITQFDPRAGLRVDRRFRDEITGEPCIDFDRTSWPHGDRGHARPHGVLFAVADADLR